MLISDWSSDVCSSDLAVWNDDHILTSTAERDALRRLQALGLYDAFRLHHDAGGIFSWWDYRQAAFRRDLGLRIDLTLVSDALREQAVEAGIDREPRTWERPSDHTPAWVRLRSEEHTSELQSLMRNSYAVFCLK